MYYVLWRSQVSGSKQKLNSWQLLFNILPQTPETKTWINSSFSTESWQRGHLKPTAKRFTWITPSFPLPQEVQTNQGVCLWSAKPHLHFLHHSAQYFVIPLINWKETSRNFMHGAQASQSTHMLFTNHYFSSHIQSSVFRAAIKKKSLQWILDLLFGKKQNKTTTEKGQLLSQELKCQTWDLQIVRKWVKEKKEENNKTTKLLNKKERE